MANCVGCGDDVTNAKGKRSLSNKASYHVIPLLEMLVEEELVRLERDESFDSFISTHNGKLCRKCFSSFEKYSPYLYHQGIDYYLMLRCVTIQNSLKHGVAAAVTKLLGEHTSLPDACADMACASSSTLTPKRRIPSAQQSAAKRRAVDHDTSNSPDVVVSIHTIVNKCTSYTDLRTGHSHIWTHYTH